MTGMILGVTGSRSGITNRQSKWLNDFFNENDISRLLHGDCQGADEAADTIAMKHGIKRWAMPGVDALGRSPYRAHCTAEYIADPRPYLVRNKEIVDSCELLIALPKSVERPRSGTWATIRYARQINRVHIIVYPNGELGIS